MKMQIITVAAAALFAAPMLQAQATATPTPATAAQAGRQHKGRDMGPRGHQRGDMMKQLNLTADQQSRIKSIRSRYATQFKAARASAKPDMDAMKAARARGDTAGVRAAREKMRADMAPSMKLRQQQMAEMRAVLTPDQQKQLDAQRAKMKAGKHSGRKHGLKAKKPLAPQSAVPASRVNR